MSKKSIILYCITSFVVLMFFIVARIPANNVFYLVSKQTSLISVSQVSGTIWQGKASNININYGGNEFSLGQSSWEIHPLTLLLGKLSTTVNFVNGDQIIKGKIGLGITKSITVEDTEVALSPALLAKVFPYPGKIDGMLEMSIVEFAFSDGQIKVLDVSGVIKNCVYTLNVPVVLGTHGGKLSLVKDRIKAVLSDVDAPMSLSGEVFVTPDSKEYSLDLNIIPKSSADPILVQTLDGFFKKSDDGSYAFTFNGKF